MNSLMQAGKADDAFPVQKENGSVDTLWLPEIERFVILLLHVTVHFEDINLAGSCGVSVYCNSWMSLSFVET
jgi:hypothetical protein